MIRRGFWLTAGAVLGVMGYRKLTQLAGGLTNASVVSGTPSGSTRPAGAGAAPGDPPTPPVPGQAPRQPPASTVARIVAAVRFARDVRVGIAEYLDLHHRELARTLGSRSGRSSSG